MADIFVCYAREDHDTACSLARAFEGEGWSVFWDQTIPPGERFDMFIEKNLSEARCVIALWSKAASQSTWVLEEADYGQAKQILIPALIEDTIAPLGFRYIQAANLIGWKHGISHSGYQQLVGAIKRKLTTSSLSNSGIRTSTTTSWMETTQEVEPRSPTVVDDASYGSKIQSFIAEWFHNLDNHVFAETFYPMISTEDLEMMFPNGKVRGMAGFRDWYEGVICIFFNESHIVRNVRLSLSGNHVVADVIVTWQADRWKPPEPKSQQLGFDVNLELEIGFSPNDKPIMLRYTVKELRPLPGSAPL